MPIVRIEALRVSHKRYAGRRECSVTTATFPSSEIRPVISLSPSDHASGSSQGSPALGQHGGVGAVVRLGVLGHDEAIPAGAQQLADAACGAWVVERSPGDT